MKGIPRSRGRSPAIALLAAVLAVLLFSGGCLGGRPAGVEAVLSEAGEPEPGTTAAWVRGRKEAHRATAAEERIISTPEGQWAVGAEASSSLGDISTRPGWTPEEATGAPDVPGMGVANRAWGPANENAGYEWLVLSYAVPVKATAVRIRQVNGSGSVVLVELEDTDGRHHVKWKGEDKPKEYVVWLVLEFPETKYRVNAVRITLDTTAVAHWKLIDAVQLEGQP